jgi:hypothetical protein
VESASGDAAVSPRNAAIASRALRHSPPESPGCSCQAKAAARDRRAARRRECRNAWKGTAAQRRTAMHAKPAARSARLSTVVAFYCRPCVAAGHRCGRSKGWRSSLKSRRRSATSACRWRARTRLRTAVSDRTLTSYGVLARIGSSAEQSYCRARPRRCGASAPGGAPTPPRTSRPLRDAAPPARSEPADRLRQLAGALPPSRIGRMLTDATRHR